MFSSPRRRALLAIPAISLVLLGACADDDTSSDTTTTPSGLTDETTTTGSDTNGGDVQAQLEEALRDAGLTSLASAVAQVDLSDLLEGNEFTIFAPNDDAFLALDSDDLSALLADPGRIGELLQNHIVVGSQLTAEDLEGAGTVTTEAGATLTVAGSASGLTVEGATVTDSRTVGDGIFHVIDTVLTDGIIP